MVLLHLTMGLDFLTLEVKKNKFFDDAMAPNIDFITLAGNGGEGNEDGLGGNSTFSQPTGLCCEGNTIFTVDSGAKTVHIITSPSALAKYLKKYPGTF